MMPARSRTGSNAPSSLAATLLLSLVCVSLSGEDARAQTPYTDLGLGYPVPAVDARAAALGGVAVGLDGGSFTLRNPADLVAIDAPALSATLSPENVTLRGGEEEAQTSRNRFPLLRGVVPVGDWSIGLGFGSELDQDWTFRFRDSLQTQQGTFPYVERRERDGGLSSVDVSVARRLGPVSLGASYQYLTGGLRQVLVRRFPEDGDFQVSPPATVNQAEEFSYSSWRVRGGLAIHPLEWIRLAVSYGTTGELTADREGSGVERSFDLPDEVEAKVSLRLSETWLATAGGGQVTWSSVRGDLPDGSARDVAWGGGGVEYGGVRLGSFPLSLRAGARFAELPFFRPGREPADERALTLGVGTVFSDDRAALDFALEAGSRGDAPATGVDEDFLRLSFTATIRQ